MGREAKAKAERKRQREETRKRAPHPEEVLAWIAQQNRGALRKLAGG